jgi:two-component system, OmpR family, response regulator
MTTVLVVDDDRNLRRLVGVALEAEGYDVLKAQNGIEALNVMCSTTQPLVVLLDLQMPQLGGAGVLGAVTADKKLTTRNRYMLMTGHARNLPVALANLLIALHVPVLAKPFKVDQLVEMVAQTVRTLPSH